MNSTPMPQDQVTQQGQTTLWDLQECLCQNSFGSNPRCKLHGDITANKPYRSWQQKSGDSDITINYSRSNPQSVAANKLTNKVRDRQLILEALERHPNGLTCEQVEDLIFSKHQSVSARISELKRAGLISKIGTAKTRSGCSAALYKIV